MHAVANDGELETAEDIPINGAPMFLHLGPTEASSLRNVDLRLKDDLQHSLHTFRKDRLIDNSRAVHLSWTNSLGRSGTARWMTALHGGDGDGDGVDAAWQGVKSGNNK